MGTIFLQAGLSRLHSIDKGRNSVGDKLLLFGLVLNSFCHCYLCVTQLRALAVATMTDQPKNGLRSEAVSSAFPLGRCDFSPQVLYLMSIVTVLNLFVTSGF